MAVGWGLAGRGIAVGALAAAVALGGASLAKPKKAGSDEDAVTRVVAYALKHKDSVGHFAGQRVHITALFASVERQDDPAVGKRADHARVFQVILDVTPPDALFDQYVGCQVSADTDYAKAADATPAGQPPTSLDRQAFTVEGEIDSFSIPTGTRAGLVMLKPGCTVMAATP